MTTRNLRQRGYAWRMATVAVLLCPIAWPADARAGECEDRIAVLDTRLDRAGTAATAASSGGQAVAASRGGQASQDDGRGAPGVAPITPFQAPAAEARATGEAVAAGGGGDGVIQARAKLNEARAKAAAGDAAACMASAAEAERLLPQR